MSRVHRSFSRASGGALRGLLLLGVLASGSVNAQMNSATITAATINPFMLPCFNHCVIGICFWLRITPLGPRIETTLKVKHNFPDLVVTVFEHHGDQPWLEVSPISLGAGVAAQSYGLLSGTTVQGGRHTPANNQEQNQTTKTQQDTRRMQVRFYEAEAYGHPLASALGGSLGGFGVAVPGVCPINTTSLFPYFLSGTDVLSWRNPEAELLYPATYIPYLREVRNDYFTSVWGNVFPRHGFLSVQSEPRKAAAVMAQRAADITTSSFNPHVYIRARGAAANERTDLWQNLYPVPSRGCGPFGESGLLPSFQINTLKDTYAWQLWRPYQCCLPNRGAVFIREVATPAVCLRFLVPNAAEAANSKQLGTFK